MSEINDMAHTQSSEPIFVVAGTDTKLLFTVTPNASPEPEVVASAEPVAIDETYLLGDLYGAATAVYDIAAETVKKYARPLMAGALASGLAFLSVGTSLASDKKPEQHKPATVAPVIPAPKAIRMMIKPPCAPGQSEIKPHDTLSQKATELKVDLKSLLAANTQIKNPAQVFNECVIVPVKTEVKKTPTTKATPTTPKTTAAPATTVAPTTQAPPATVLVPVTAKVNGSIIKIVGVDPATRTNPNQHTMDAGQFARQASNLFGKNYGETIAEITQDNGSTDFIGGKTFFIRLDPVKAQQVDNAVRAMDLLPAETPAEVPVAATRTVRVGTKSVVVPTTQPKAVPLATTPVTAAPTTAKPAPVVTQPVPAADVKVEGPAPKLVPAGMSEAYTQVLKQIPDIQDAIKKYDWQKTRNLGPSITAEDVARLSYAKGFRGEDLVVAVEVGAFAEGGGHPFVVNTAASKGGKLVVAVGLDQILYSDKLDTPERDPQSNLNPETNVENAFRIYNQAHGWGPWLAVKNGSAAKHRTAALAALKNAGLPTPPVPTPKPTAPPVTLPQQNEQHTEPPKAPKAPTGGKPQGEVTAPQSVIDKLNEANKSYPGMIDMDSLKYMKGTQTESFWIISVKSPNGSVTNVNIETAPKLAALYTAAINDGMSSLGTKGAGGGFRSIEAQIERRKANGCPDVMKSPAKACDTPTARPGKSEHNKGDAIDFTGADGHIIAKDSKEFKWLAGNASKYGFYNLPSEPWHWSTNGK